MQTWKACKLVKCAVRISPQALSGNRSEPKKVLREEMAGVLLEDFKE